MLVMLVGNFFIDFWIGFVIVYRVVIVIVISFLLSEIEYFIFRGSIVDGRY